MWDKLIEMELLWKVVAIKAINLDQSKQLILFLINQNNRSCVPMINSEVVAIKTIIFDQSYANFDNVKSEEAKNISLLAPNSLQIALFLQISFQLWLSHCSSILIFLFWWWHFSGSFKSIISFSFRNGLFEPCITVVLKETLEALSYLYKK